MQAHILDVAPTVLHAMGRAVPSYMEGKVLMEMWEDECLAQRPVRHTEVKLDECRQERERAVPDREGEGTVRERLRDLGYV